MYDEAFAENRSAIHRLDPRVRLSMALLGAICIAVLRGPTAALFGLGLSLGLLLCSRPPLRQLLRSLRLINIFILFLWLIVPLSMGGERVIPFGPLTLSKSGISLVLLATLKANALLFLCLALVSTMNSATLGHALKSLRFPDKLVFLLLFTYRHIHVAAEEWQKLVVSAKLRAFVPKTDMHTYRTFGNMLGMTFVRSFERSAKVYEAMQLRGFTGNFQSVSSFRLQRSDLGFALGLGSILAGISGYDLYTGLLRV
jgi:cobalt/nickel transport system permease protein